VTSGEIARQHHNRTRRRGGYQQFDAGIIIDAAEVAIRPAAIVESVSGHGVVFFEVGIAAGMQAFFCCFDRPACSVPLAGFGGLPRQDMAAPARIGVGGWA
jgi:hypothetical protein